MHFIPCMKKRFYCSLVVAFISFNCFSQVIDYNDYTLAFDEQFNYTSPADTAMMNKWSYGPMDEDWSGGIEWVPKDDTSHLFILTDSLGNHYLRIRAEKMRYPVPLPHTQHPLRHYWSGMLVSKTGNDPVACPLAGVPQNGYRFGLFEMRAKLPKGDPRGWDAWPAFWMRSMGAEIDIIDDITNDPGHKLIAGFINWWRNPKYDSNPQNTETYRWDVVAYDSTVKDYDGHNEYRAGDLVNYSFDGSAYTFKANGPYGRTSVVYDTQLPEGEDLSQDFHVFGFEWTPDSMKIILDGKVIHANVFSPPFLQTYDCAMRMAVNLSVMGNGEKMNPNSDTRMDMDIDYIRVWKRKR